ncbi:DNA starvation/stationary phase protection protein [Novosphingobium profundi]|uniref:Dps family protein n=1 Tax=Novosphingobium profundi TaxID=1774954 RepID=UPI001BDB10C0|nr:DNA starvation/stationary phase protection protein [Novosphingobium profundi]MBT0668367.1 DNA starvation/stationary phase protection protein [Novosphingobium profundi]
MASNDNAKGALIDSLNGLLADTFALYIKTKNFHWHVKGPQFRDLHLLFDDQAAQVQALIDTIAERVRKQGGTTLTSPDAIVSKTKIAPQDSTSIEPMAMVKELMDDNIAYIERLREVKAAAGEAGDNATDGIVDDWTDQAEERAWFLREIIA